MRSLGIKGFKTDVPYNAVNRIIAGGPQEKFDRIFTAMMIKAAYAQKWRQIVTSVALFDLRSARQGRCIPNLLKRN